MKIKIPKPSELHLTEEQAKRLLKILFGDDLDYYEECIMHLPDEEQEIFLKKIQTLCRNILLVVI